MAVIMQESHNLSKELEILATNKARKASAENTSTYLEAMKEMISKVETFRRLNRRRLEEAREDSSAEDSTGNLRNSEDSNELCSLPAESIEQSKTIEHCLQSDDDCNSREGRNRRDREILDRALWAELNKLQNEFEKIGFIET
ncbi:hypothetical protein R1flu_027185 [Riccia fluitans]|uniref:Uncharacterized protein n=1 Tax=Riccia fluitans TaxID=41844 RepID=A0ABD1XI52_9MARC